MKTGDILVSTWGWEQTNAYFYRVVKASVTTVTLQRVRTLAVSDGERTMTGAALPSADDEPEPPIRRKVQRWYDGSCDYCKVSSYANARPWNGKPVRVSWYG